MSGNPAPTPDWWQRPPVLVVLVVLSVVPLLWPPVPPLIDLPGHMGRYAVQLDPASFAQWYAFRWQLLGNLGVDLLVVPLSQVFGLELAVKLIVMTIPAMTVAGLLWIAAEVHGRIPPTALFALPLAYGHPFHFGFVNFTLGMGLTLLAFALWLRMARGSSKRLRAVVFAVLACAIWVAHTFAWGVLGLLCFSAEFVRRHDRGEAVAPAMVRAGLACLPMALPLIPMLLWRTNTNAYTGQAFDWVTKTGYIMRTLRDRWIELDMASLGAIAAVLAFALWHARLGFARSLALATVILLATFALLPRIIFGSAYADMRLLPFIFAIAVVAIRTDKASARMLGIVAGIGLAFFIARIAATTTSMAIVSNRWEAALGALDHVPVGARVVSFTRWACKSGWKSDRLEHVPALGMVRRKAFANDQWQVDGANLMTVIKNDAPGFVHDPSQMVTPTLCPKSEWRTLDQSFHDLPRDAFDYVWLLDPPAYDVRLTQGMTLVWARGNDRLYRIAAP